MNQKQVLELIEAIVQPLRDKITNLEKENERLKAHLASLGMGLPRHEYLRQRSSKNHGNTDSKEERPSSKRGEQKDAHSPRKKEDKAEKPAWSYARGRQENSIKSPETKNKPPLIPHSPKTPQRQLSKDKQDKQETEKRVGDKIPQKKITGGKKVQSSINESHQENPPHQSNHITPPVEANHQ